MKKACSCGKHAKRKNRRFNKKKVVLIAVLLLALIIVFTLFIANEFSNYKQSEVSTNVIEDDQNEAINTVANEIDTREIVDVEMPDKIESYDVVGQLVIDKVGFDKYIINKTTDYSLKLSITRFYGPKVNQPGNLCITGHNTDKFFGGLKRLSIDDTFYIIDKETCEKVTYQIKKIYTVNPTDLSCLGQDTNDKREVTLITCNPRRVN